MGLGFLTPVFLAGLGLLLVPVLVHLRQRHRSRRVAFPSLMFLRRIEHPSVRRRRIRHWSLLMLRSLALALLVLAFARPLLEGEVTAADRLVRGRELVVLLDNSFSLGYEERWESALESTRAALHELRDGDRASLLVFSDRATVLAASSAEPPSVLALLEDVEISSRTTRFSPAFKTARKLVVDSPLPRRQVLLVSDFQRLGWEPGDSLRLPPGTDLRGVDVSADDPAGDSPSNLSVVSAAVERSLRGDREQVTVQARVTRRGGEQPADTWLALELDGRELERRELSLGADASSLVEFEPFLLPPGYSRARLQLGPDGLETDNELFFVVSRAQTLPVLLLDAPRARSGEPRSGLYVEEALKLGHEPVIEVRRRSPRALSSADLAAVGVVVVSDVDVDGRSVERLADFVEDGGGLLLALGSRSEQTLERLYSAGLAPEAGGGEVGETESRVKRLSFIDRTDAVFEPFARPRSGDFGTARFFRYRNLEPEPGDRVLGRFDDGGAALISRSVGEGRVLIWTSSLDTYWNDLPLQPVFLPFLHQAVRALSEFRPPPPWHTVGDVVELGQMASGMLRVATPGGHELEVEELLSLEEKGFYELSEGGEEVGILAANVDVREADLTPMDVDELLAAARPLGEEQPEAGTRPRRSAAERESRQGLWRYLVLLGLALLVGEVFLANRLSTVT